MFERQSQLGKRTTMQLVNSLIKVDEMLDRHLNNGGYENSVRHRKMLRFRNRVIGTLKERLVWVNT